MATSPFSVRIDDDVRKKLKDEANQLRRSESFVANEAIKKYLIAAEAKRRAIDAALSLADEGEFVSSQAMADWVDSWGTDQEKALPEADIKP